MHNWVFFAMCMSRLQYVILNFAVISVTHGGVTHLQLTALLVIPTHTVATLGMAVTIHTPALLCMCFLLSSSQLAASAHNVKFGGHALQMAPQWWSQRAEGM